jgi:RNA polymerase sigma factor (sigma-70 family)
MQRNTLSLEQAYDRLRPLFFGALASLARQGFVASPADSMDLIHDFFAEAWQGLEDRFDPDKGSFEGYAYRAFVQFARPRIVRLRRWQHCLIETEDLDTLPAQPSEEAESIDQERVREAIAKLPTGEQEILRRYVYSDYPSERRLARQLGVSRYRLREILVDALGRVAVSFDRPAGIAPEDWEVARTLWRDRRTVQEAAAVLQLTSQQVRSAYERNVTFLSEALKNWHPETWSPERRKKMASQPQPASFVLVLLKALRSPDDRELLEDVRRHAEQILVALESTGSAIPAEGLDNVPTDWVAEVYQALFRGAGADLQSAAEAAQSAEAHEKEDIAIGRAFRETLLADLTDDLKYPQEIRSLPEISRGEQKRLGTTPDVVAGRPESEWWLVHGVRPLTVFYTTKSVSGLLNRYVGSDLPRQAQAVLSAESLVIQDDAKSSYSSAIIKEEISRRAECSSQIASALYSWVIKVAQYKPWLFAGFEAQPQPGGRTVRLTPSKERFEQTYQQWGLKSLRRVAPVAVSMEKRPAAPETRGTEP